MSRKLLLRLLWLLLIPKLIAAGIPELIEGIPELGRVEECINAIDEGLEEGTISILSNSSLCGRLLVNLS